ncbi:DUF7574 domain-containing protein [Rhodococcus qingshengii]|uniref:DUF7574 domain-containing protein n=1 Tax=Rhodococcus qingshengii TaxID=334542 RepID=UPI001ADF1ECD|nr:hypothetical protein [Rhodococcus qingshengii]MCQ4150261.1 hypothetical protein [Rhodococcus qingshengii]
MSNVYYEPEAFGLTTVGELDLGGGYDFDKFVIWQDNGSGRLWYAEDRGCSCPSPFEDVSFTNGMTEVHTPQQLIDAIHSWRNDEDNYRDSATDGLDGDAGQLIVKAREIATFSNELPGGVA